MKNKGPIYTKSFEFALMILSLKKKLNKQKEFDLGRQILRSGTAIGANVNEAGAAVSKKDFTNKMGIASKEARESLYWLELLKASDAMKVNVEQEYEMCLELVKLLTAIVKTSQLSTKN
ncbi:four helix bundle protein [Gracilimonas amylolytica]|uniref:four helix bundle protein n=1 Tax=Gracilimonas amylolytica TaxID=1749045 RepID=UPI000CD99787|nr:four helix bundle protein [Gracilimonas amylolytica]